jgi:hypothetical protein
MPSAERYWMSDVGPAADVNLPPTYSRSSRWRARCREIWHGGFGPGAAGKGPDHRHLAGGLPVLNSVAVGLGGIQASGSPPSVACCFAHQAARISVSADTATAWSASDSVGTRTGASTTTGLVREPCPPRSTSAMPRPTPPAPIRHARERSALSADRPRRGRVSVVAHRGSRRDAPSHVRRGQPIQDPQ